jgi:hypothetical protein
MIKQMRAGTSRAGFGEYRRQVAVGDDIGQRLQTGDVEQ